MPAPKMVRTPRPATTVVAPTRPRRRPATASTPTPGPADLVAARSMMGNAAVTAVLGGLPPGAEPGRSAWLGPTMLAGQDLVGNQAVANGATTLEPGKSLPPGALPVAGPEKPKPPKPKPGEPRPGVPKPVPPPAPKPEVKDQKDKPPAERPGKEPKKTKTGPPRSPAADPKFQALKKDVDTKKRKVGASHPPPAVEAGSAQGAAVPPADDQEARGKAAHAEEMDAAEPKAFDKQAFVDAVKKAIADRAPKNLEEADEFGGSGKAEEVKAEVQGKVGEGKDASSKEITDTTAEVPQPAPDAKKVVPMAADQVPGKPGAPNPNQAAPDALPPEDTDMSAGPEQVGDQMAAAQVTEKQLSLENSREPSFGKAAQDKKAMDTHSAQAPGRLRKSEAKEIKEVKTNAAGTGATAMTGIHATRVTTGKKVGTGKKGAKGRDEEKRVQVTAILQKVFDQTKCDVEKILSNLDKAVDRQFTAGEKAARNGFTAEHEEGMRRYKAERYGGWDGPFLWAKDKFMDLPEEANRIYERARDNYLAAMEQVITGIAGTVERELNRAKERIATGRKDLKKAVDKLPADLKEIGREAASEFEGKFDELKDTVNDKGTELVDTLATKYTDAVKSVDAEIAAEKEKNKGLVTKAAEAIGDAIETIKELGRMLMNVLRKAVSAIGLILRDPIGFLGRLITGVGGGLKLFKKSAGRHLQQGVLAWLLGSGATAGLKLPTSFDVLGILVMIAALLGISWPNIRTRLARKVNPKVMTAAETGKDAIPIVVEAKKRGVAGLWSDLKSRVGDLKKDLISKLVSYLLPTIILAGITWIISLFNPASAFIRACKMIIDIIRFIVTQARQIFEFINAVLDAVIAIARGGTGGVPALIERALARSIPVLIGALAAILGIGGIAGKVKQIFQQISRPVNRAIDWVINKITGLLKKLWNKIKPKRKPKKPAKRRKPEHKDKPRRPRGPRRPKRQRKPKKPDRPKDRKRKDRRSEKDKRRALAAALRDANKLIGAESATVKSVRQGLPSIKRCHSLTSIRLIKSGDRYHIALAINPAGDSESHALDFRFTKTGERIVKRVHNSWWTQLLSKAKFGSGTPVWAETVLDGTESAALTYIETQDVAAFRKKHPRAAPEHDVARDYLFKKGASTRQSILEKLGGDEGALPKLKSTGKTTAAADEKTVELIDDMQFNADRSHYGRWDPFPSREADADQELVAAVNASAEGLRGFLKKMVRNSQVGAVTWARFQELWANDTPSREFVKNRFRDLDSGKHEWIPTDYLIEVVRSAIKDKSRIEQGLDWLSLQDALRSPTNYVIFRVLDAEGLLSLGAHVGTFYTAERKSTLTSGTKEFHDGLRKLYEQNKSGTAQAFVELLLGMLDHDAEAGPSDFKLIWSGDLGDLPAAVKDRPVGALFRAQTNEFLELTVAQLGARQQLAFAAVRRDFVRAQATLKG